MTDMSADLQGLTRGGRGGGGNDGYGDHAFGSVAGYVIQPGSNTNKPNYDDMVIVDLQRPALGIEASPENPVRINVKIEAPKPSANSKARAPLAVFHVKNGRGTARETLVGDFLTLKDIKRTGADNFTARRVEVAVRKYDQEKHFVHSGLFSIRPEKERKGNDGTPYFSQLRIGLLTQFADPVSSIDTFKERALQALADAGAVHGARPHFVLRGIQENENGKHHFSIAREVGLYDYEARREFSPEEAVDRFISGEDNNHGPKILQYLGGEGVLFEVIPQFRVNTGSASLPSAKKQAAIDGNRYDAAKDWMYDDGHAQRFLTAENRTETGYSMMDVVLQRLPNQDNPEVMGKTHTIFSQPQKKVLPLFSLAQVITPNLSASLAADCLRLANDRSKAVFEASKNPKAPSQEQDQDQDLDQGAEQDHGGSAPPGM
jgi:hypothetical protein